MVSSISTTAVKGVFASCLWSKMVVSSHVSVPAATATTRSTVIGTHFLRGPVQVVGSGEGFAEELMSHHLSCPTPSWQRMHDTVSPLWAELFSICSTKSPWQ